MIHPAVVAEAEFVGYKGKPIEAGPYYHGTSTALDIKDSLRAPMETGKQTEKRSQRRGKVFFTNSLESAQHYAGVAVKKWGGEPVVYKVEPFGRVKQFSRRASRFGPAFHADGAKVKGTVKAEKTDVHPTVAQVVKEISLSHGNQPGLTKGTPAKLNSDGKMVMSTEKGLTDRGWIVPKGQPEKKKKRKDKNREAQGELDIALPSPPGFA